jgi:O-Antigen ligase
MILLAVIAAVVVGIPLFLLLIRSPYSGVLMMLCAIAVEPMTMGHGVSLALIVGLLAGLAWLVRTLATKEKIALPPFWLGLMAYIGAAILSIFAQDPGSVDWVKIAFTYLSYLLTVVLIYNVVDSPEKLRGSVQCFCLGLTALVIGSLLIFLFVPSLYTKLHPSEAGVPGGLRMDTGFSDVGHSANSTAKLLVTLIPTQAVLYLSAGIFGKIVVVGSLGLWFIGLALIESRGAVVGALAALTVYAFLGQRSIVRRSKQLVGIGSIALVIVLLVVLNPAYLARFGDLPVPRFILWLIAFRSFLEHPILGVGTGRFTQVVIHNMSPGLAALFSTRIDVHWFVTSGSNTVAHSILFNILAENGLVGLLAFTWFIGGVLSLGLHTIQVRGRLVPTFESDLTRSLVAGLIGFLAHSLFSGGERERTLYVIAALIAVAAQIERTFHASDSVQHEAFGS